MKIDFNQIANDAGKWVFAGFFLLFGLKFGEYVFALIPWPHG